MDTSLFDLIRDKINSLEGPSAYATIFGVLLACGLGVPIPEDITLVTAGFLAYSENIELPFAIMTGFAGVLAGDFILFTLGRILGKRVFQLPGISHIVTPTAISFAEAKLKKNAWKVCFTARFLAGLRAPIYLAAGMLGVRPVLFIAMDSLAALISVPTLVLVGWWFGDEIEMAFLYMRRGEKYIIILLAIVGMIFVTRYLHGKFKAGEDELVD